MTARLSMGNSKHEDLAVSVSRTALSDGDLSQVIETRSIGWVELGTVLLRAFIAVQRSTAGLYCRRCRRSRHASDHYSAPHRQAYTRAPTNHQCYCYDRSCIGYSSLALPCVA